MKNQSIQIPTPCHEKWEAMTPNEKGAHCKKCAITVVDFTKMSDKELIDYFENRAKGEKTCGRLTNTQLNRTLSILEPNPTFFQSFKKVLLACFFGLSLPAFAKAEKITTPIENYQTIKIATNTKSQDLLPAVIKGTVKNENGGLTPYAVILIKDTKIGCVSDIDGNFELELTDSLQQLSEITLIVKYLGADDTSFVINTQNANQEQLIIMKYYTVLEIGSVVYQKKRKKWRNLGFESRKLYRKWKKA